VRELLEDCIVHRVSERFEYRSSGPGGPLTYFLRQQRSGEVTIGFLKTGKILRLSRAMGVSIGDEITRSDFPFEIVFKQASKLLSRA
jgi:hypothetical protein